MPDSSPQPALAQPVHAVLVAVRRHARAVWLGAAVLGPIGAAALILFVAVVADRFLVLPALLRLALLAAVIGVPVWLVRRLLRARPGGSDLETAQLIEKKYPDLNNLLINSLQLARDTESGSEPFVTALASEARHAIQQTPALRAVSKRRLLVAGTATGAAVVLWLGLAAGSDALGPAVNRVVLPFADNTLTKILDVRPGDCDVLVNSDVTVVATMGRRVPQEAQLLCTRSDGREVVLTMTAVSESLPDRLVTTIERVEMDTYYEVQAGDDRSEAFAIVVHERPQVVRIVQRIAPPPYVHALPVEQAGGTIRALAGSRVDLSIETRHGAIEGRLVFDDDRSVPIDFSEGEGMAGFDVLHDGTYRVELTGAHGFANEPTQYAIHLIDDRVPAVRIVQPSGDLEVDMDATVEIGLEARDDWAVQRAALVSVDPSQGPDIQVAQWEAQTHDQERLSCQTTLSVAELGLDRDTPITLRAVAFDFRPDAPAGHSDLLTIRLKGAEAQDTASAASAIPSLSGLIAAQRTNIARSIAQHAAESAGEGFDGLVQRQAQIRADALAIAGGADAAGHGPGAELLKRLQNLARTLMVLAVEQLRDAPLKADVKAALARAIDTQKAILMELIRADAARDEPQDRQQQLTIAQKLSELIARQTTLRQDTVEASHGDAALMARQRDLARQTAGLKRLIESEAERGAGGNAQLATQYEQMAAAFADRKVRPNMLLAFTKLEAGDRDAAVALQDAVIQDLIEIQKLLRDALLAEAKKELAQSSEGLSEAKKKVDKMADVQKAIKQVAAQLRKNQDLAEEGPLSPEDLEDLTEARQNMAEVVEQLIEDMHLLPQMSASDDLIGEFSEIYEDVKQAEGSGDDPVSEIAVDLDEALLDALEAMRQDMGERLADLEMWLSDKPDTTRWNMESHDRDALGRIPLGDLPDGLEDIVGDMLDQSESLSQEAEDAVSNIAVPDMTMGWDIMDGPMPSWAAKGKSGNEKPNANEQTGRSGSGRQGKSSGEMVGDTVKALEGAEVEARRTEDAFLSGQVKQEEAGALDIKATGGGKVAGTTESEGMSGDAPPRDELKYRELARGHFQLKRDARSVYSKAKLLRLPTGQLDRALLALDAASRRLQDGDLAGFARSQNEVARAFRDTRAALAGRSAVLGPSGGERQTPIEAGATGEPIPSEYEDAVAGYMRRIAKEAP